AELKVGDTVKLTAQIAGTSKATIYNILKEKKTKNYVSAPKKSSGRPAIKLDEDSKYAIRRIVHSFFFKNEPPTLDKVLTAIHADGDLPKLTR
ncbi:unnamed protein product, partial [Tenebrio molitor]